MDLKSYDRAELDEWDLWDLFPQHRWVFNKLELSLRLGYSAAPVPKPVPYTGEYVVRPIYNLSGMGIGAELHSLKAGEVLSMPPSRFWCERFLGSHYSVNYYWKDDRWVEVQTSEAETNFEELSKFKNWKLIENQNIPLPEWIDEFADVQFLNIEFIGNKIIEIHLRWGIDFPEGSTEIIPVWRSCNCEEILSMISNGYSYIEDYVDAEQNLKDPRLGFLFK